MGTPGASRHKTAVGPRPAVGARGADFMLYGSNADLEAAAADGGSCNCPRPPGGASAAPAFSAVDWFRVAVRVSAWGAERPQTAVSGAGRRRLDARPPLGQLLPRLQARRPARPAAPTSPARSAHYSRCTQHIAHCRFIADSLHLAPRAVRLAHASAPPPQRAQLAHRHLELGLSAPTRGV
jgi:hypothetical protein